MAYKVLDGAYAKLAGTVAIGATSTVVETGKGALFDVGTDHSYITFENDAKVTETVKITGRSGDTLTHTVTTKEWNVNDIVECRPCAQAIADLATAVQISESAAKATPVDADKFGFIDSAASWVLKYISWADMKAKIFAAWGALTAAATSKAAPVDADSLTLSDSADSNATKKLTIANLLAKVWSALGSLIAAGTEKATPVDADMVVLADSAASNASKKTTIASLRSALGGGGAGQFKNKIIGGDFMTNPWQRGTSFTAPATGAFLADRFYLTHSTDAVVDALKTADAPTAAEAGVFSQHCLHFDVTTADAAIAAAQSYVIRQRIEGLNAACFGFGQVGTRYVTLSFWHKHTKTGVYCVTFNNSVVDRSYVAEYTQAVTNTWEKATITVPVDTSGTWLYNSGIGLQIYWVLAAGTDYHTSVDTWNAGNFFATANQVNALDNTANNFKIALVQLEAGQTATDFETRSVGQELTLCQRYYYRFGPEDNAKFGVGGAGSATLGDIFTRFPVEMRIAPAALEQTGTATDYSLQSPSAGEVICSAVPAFTSADKTSATTRLTVAAGLTANGALFGRLTAASAYLGWSAEL